MGKGKRIKSHMQNDNRCFAYVAGLAQVVIIILFAFYVDYPGSVKQRADGGSHAPAPETGAGIGIGIGITEATIDANIAGVKVETKTETKVEKKENVDVILTIKEKLANKSEEKAEAVDASAEVNTYYPMFQDVHTMIFIGFGFLMTFLKRYSYSSVGLNLFLAAFAIQWASLVFGFLNLKPNEKIYTDMSLLINAEFTAGTVLISFGAVLGKTTPLQLLLMTILEVVISKGSEHICVHFLHATDVGGSMLIHAFGAYFGLAVSASLNFKRKQHLESENEVATKTSDVFAMVGTVFLWMFWPSFNGALAVGALRQRAIINTYFALAGAAVACFVMSALVEPRNRFNMVHVQNASLAGGVAIGTCADMLVGPFAAMIIGCLAAIVSVIGYRYFTPRLNKYIHDTCGVHDLHGMPGVIGALAGVLFTGLGKYDANPDAIQAGCQMASLCVTFAFAVVGGLIVGVILRLPFIRQINDPSEFYDDHKYWHVPTVQTETQPEANGVFGEEQC